MAKKRRPGPVREDLSEEEIRRIRRRRKQKKIRALKRRIYAVLLLILIIIIGIVIIRHRRKSEDLTTVSENGGLPTSGAAGFADDVYSSGFEETENAEGEGEVQDTYEYLSYSGESVMTPNEPLNVTTGRAAVDLSSASDNSVGMVQAAKAAMAQMAYFTGTTRTVNDFLTSYGEGSWHALIGASGELCVFYEGMHAEYTTVTDEATGETVNNEVDIPFKITFIM